MFTSTGRTLLKVHTERREEYHLVVQGMRNAMHGGDDRLSTIARKLHTLRAAEAEANEERERQISHYRTRVCGLCGSQHSNLVSTICMGIGALIDLSGLTLDALGTLTITDETLKTAIIVSALALLIFGTLSIVIGIIMRCAGMDATKRIIDLQSPELTNQEITDIRRLLNYLDSVAELDEQKDDTEENIKKLGAAVSELPSTCCGYSLYQNREEVINVALTNLCSDHPLKKNLALLQSINQRKLSVAAEVPPNMRQDSGNTTIADQLMQEWKGTREEGLSAPQGDSGQQIWLNLEEGLGFKLNNIHGISRKKIFR